MTTLNYTKRQINREFKIKVSGIYEGKKINTLVGVSGLIRLVADIELTNRLLDRAFNSTTDSCVLQTPPWFESIILRLLNMLHNKTNYRYEVTTADTEQELKRDGGQKEIRTRLTDAMQYALKQAQTHPYVYVEKVNMDEQGDFVDFEFIWSHNPHNW